VATARRRATYDDLGKVPDTKVAEIIDGELVVSPRPASPHALATSVLGADLIGSFHGPPGRPGQPGGWWLLLEPELHVRDDVLVPDVAGWRCARMPAVPNVAAFTDAPDWVCETMSPSTARHDRGGKMRIYAREGVRHLWLVDPLRRSIEVYRLVDGQWAVAASYAGSAPTRLEPFEQVELRPDRWWLAAS
jgi:Uma2 family endonuclease